MNLENITILITGANGFIGGHLAERLVNEEHARVRGLVRNPTAAPSGAWLTFNGDVNDLAALESAVTGCDVIIHCAAMQSGPYRLSDFRRVNVDGTMNLLRAARAAGVARIVHLSTINVHGYPPPADANADSPLCFNGDFYSVSKAEGEQAARQFARENDLPLVVVRPACTYGPRSNSWTTIPLRRVQRGAPVLIGGGSGICNAVYIDNLVDLILLALKNDVAVGHAFIGAEGRGVTWREFYGSYARMLGGKRLHGMPRAAALTLAAVFESLARLTGLPPRVARSSVEFYSHRVVFNIDKSKQLLGYEPRVSFAEGMARTKEWLQKEKVL
jgi:nucleoside-diphosphate-sugar epimerase